MPSHPPASPRWNAGGTREGEGPATERSRAGHPSPYRAVGTANEKDSRGSGGRGTSAVSGKTQTMEEGERTAQETPTKKWRDFVAHHSSSTLMKSVDAARLTRRKMPYKNDFGPAIPVCTSTTCQEVG